MNRISEEHLSTTDFVPVGNDVQVENAPPGPLFPPDAIHDLRRQWTDIQAGFVDEPHGAVRRADELVAAAMTKLAEGFAEQRSGLERQWAGGSEVSTEDLRIALRKYRAFFERLLSIQAPA